MSDALVNTCKQISKNLLEIKYFAEKKNTSRTSVYRALQDKKINEVVIGKNSRFIILDDLAKKWKPGRQS
ncbi:MULTISPECIES: hypothetical protein [Leptospira]|uniref:DNA-binding protein n=6 Tax=Leptospira TaxID=171 RepID=A0A6H3NIW0_9LEPT|nr:MULTISPECIES: hypothetical protein [Leptospira]EMY62342.1 hypothetical protein LEP1GSC203_2286 [Leptospira terpstrae serovar Hualin str. LT 11-33 = ATCC 700639]EMY68239.1 hypothetical protein LEP1GSC199_0875 [Leptospira vanthielii serovar Holland str. Waz Holland = ATCC 700522]EOQ96917.1 hypothetical protein LEP1GSC195_2294 [Leptospira wolbachii serovar Codice str. CDC]MBM9547928.1 hypothetical protein [Leptospira abararensis]MCG6143014.1 hypothetical protein [Leptospira bandrabouensis]